MNKAEIIAKTIEDMERNHERDEGYKAEVIVPTLNDRVPEGNSKTCDEFKHLGVECCDACHAFYAHYEMEAIDLPEGGKAWVCHAVRCALFPQTKADENSPEAKMLREMFGHAASD